MMRIFNFTFEELPLVVVNGVEGALINGEAEVSYGHDGWEIGSITVEGYRRITQAERNAGIKPWVQVPAPAALASIIHDRLMGEWSRKVDDAVIDQIEIDREDAAEYRGELHREDRMGAW
jgi:hypothetical protein